MDRNMGSRKNPQPSIIPPILSANINAAISEPQICHCFSIAADFVKVDSGLDPASLMQTCLYHLINYCYGIHRLGRVPRC